MNILNTAVVSGTGAMSAGDIAFVCLLGIGTVFVGLVCIVIIVKLLGLLLSGSDKSPKEIINPASPFALAQNETQPNAVIDNRGEFIAAVSAAIAEDLGTDVSAIRITSIKRV